MVSRRIPPPPTRFAPAISQGKAAPRPVRGRFAPPPTRFLAGSGLPQGTGMPRPAGAARQAVQAKPGLPLPLPTPVIQRAAVSTGWPLKQRPTVKCTMGQGVTGPLDRVVLYSSGFMSCSPIVLFNQTTLKGGLFHYAASDMKNQSRPLSQIFNAVNPTVIYINDRSAAYLNPLSPGEQPDAQHIAHVFTQVCNFKGEIKLLEVTTQQYYVTADENGDLLITPSEPKSSYEEIDYTGSSKPVVPDALKNDVKVFGKNLWTRGKVM